MSKISYLEFRPGRWVKLVNGEIVGPATLEEVAAWQREKAEQAKIWQDVVKQTSAPESQPGHPPEAPAGEQELAAPAKIWQDVLRQATVAEVKASLQAPLSEQELRQAAPTSEKAEAKPVKQPVATDKAHTLREASLTHPAEALTTKLSDIAAQTAKPEPTSQTALAEKVANAKTRPTARAASTTQAVKTEHKPTVRVVDMEAANKSAPPEQKTQTIPIVKATSTEEVAKAKLATERGLPKRAKAELKPMARAKPGRKAAKLEPELTSEVTLPPKQAELEPTRGATAVSQPVEEVSPTTAQDRSTQLYLWIMAGPTDDLIDTVLNGLTRYQERFRQPAEVVLCHNEDMATLEKAKLPVDVRQAKGIPPRSFWIGLK